MVYVIVGGGIAGTTAAQELRKLDPKSDILIISEEQHSLYSRVLLPHYIKGKVERDRVFLKKDSWYQENNIEIMRGVIVENLDVKNKFVSLSNGRELPYDKLLISTGGDVRPVHSDKKGVSYFRTLDDADYMLELIKGLDKGGCGGIYGGGFIACEYLNIFKHFDISTCIAFRGPYFWSSILDEEAGLLITNHLKSNGVEVHTNASFKNLTGEDCLEGFSTSSGNHKCSLLGIGIGIDPDFSWIKNAGIDVSMGVKCNEYLETNIKDIYTAGDVSEFYDVVVERDVNVGNWMNAMTQARVVAKNMFGEKTEFKLVSSYATNALGLEIIFVGDTSKKDCDNVVVYGTAKSGGVTQLFERNECIVGGIMINRNKDRSLITKLIKENGRVSDFV